MLDLLDNVDAAAAAADTRWWSSVNNGYASHGIADYLGAEQA